MNPNKFRNNISFGAAFLFFLFIATNFLAKDLDLIKEKSFDVSPGQLLQITSDLGDVIIKTWNRNEVLVKIYGDNDAERKMEFSFDQDDEGVTVIGEKEGSKLFGWFSRIEVQYEIQVPTKFDLDLKTSGGDLVSKNIEGKFNLKTSGGDIYVKNTTGDLSAATSGGNITLVTYAGNAELATSGGDIEVDGDNGNISANTSGGDIYINSSNGSVTAKTSGGDIALNYSGENLGIELRTSGGDIDVKLPMDFNADVDVRTSGGDLTNRFSENKMSKISKSVLRGKFNSGGQPLICKTSGGDITLLEK